MCAIYHERTRKRIGGWLIYDQPSYLNQFLRMFLFFVMISVEYVFIILQRWASLLKLHIIKPKKQILFISFDKQQAFIRRRKLTEKAPLEQKNPGRSPQYKQKKKPEDLNKKSKGPQIELRRDHLARTWGALLAFLFTHLMDQKGLPSKRDRTSTIAVSMDHGTFNGKLRASVTILQSHYSPAHIQPQ